MVPKIRVGNVMSDDYREGLLVEINGKPCDGVRSAKVSLDNQGFTCATIEFVGDIGFIGDSKEYEKKTQEVPRVAKEASVPLQCARILKDYCKGRFCRGCQFEEYEGHCVIDGPGSWKLEDIT